MEKLDTPDGPVSAVFEGPARASLPGLVLTHGAGGDLDTRGLRALAAALAEMGHPVVRMNLPYRDKGKGSPPAAEKSVPGFAAAFEEARRFAPGVPWAAGGRSYGGRVATMAVAAGLPAAGLVLYSYPLHPPGKPGALRVDHFPKIRVPALFLAGTDDPFGGDAVRAHLGSIAAQSSIEVVAGGDHALAVAGKRAPDGKRRSEEEVLASLAPVVSRFLQTLH